MVGNNSIRTDFQIGIINVFCLLVGCLVFGIYCSYHYLFSHIDYSSGVKAMGLMGLFIVLPSWLRKMNKREDSLIYCESQWTIAILILSLIIGFFARFINFDISSIIIAFGFVILFWYFYVDKTLFSVNKRTIWLLFFLSVAYAFTIFYNYYLMGVPPLFFERLVMAKPDNIADIMYFSGFSHIIQTYGVPSAGVDGIKYLPYNWGAMWFLAMCASLLKIPVINSYLILYPVVIVPLMFKAFFLFCQSVANLYKVQSSFFGINAVMLIIFVTALVVGPIYPILLFQGAEVDGIAYVVSLLLIFLLVTSGVGLYRNLYFSAKVTRVKMFVIWEIPLILILVGAAKVSVFYDAVILYCYFLLRARIYKKIPFFVSGIFVLILTLVVYHFCHDPYGNKIMIKPFDIVNTYLYTKCHLKGHISYTLTFIAHFVFFYFWTWMFIFAKYIYWKLCQPNDGLYDKVKASPHMRYFDLEIVALLFVVNALPGYLLSIMGGSGVYFLDVTKWVSVALFLRILVQIINLYNKEIINIKNL